jgi:predicted SAM-dependent methyltransferase
MKLHLGCWHRFIDGFVHIDWCDLPHIDYKSSVDKLPFIPTNAVELIYASHVFEYFDRDEVPQVLEEWLRVLKPGGVLRLSVPDFTKLVEVYRKSGTLRPIIGPLYGRMHIESTETLIFHKMVYDKKLLTDTLKACGFSEVSEWEWRNTEHSHVDDHSQAYYPHMQKENGIQISLNLEARKPL